MADEEERVADREHSVQCVSSINDAPSASSTELQADNTREQRSNDTDDAETVAPNQATRKDTPREDSEATDPADGSQAAAGGSVENRGKKRVAEKQLEVEGSKKTKTGEGDGVGQSVEIDEHKANDDAYEALRERANTKLKRFQGRIKEFEDKLKEATEDLKEIVEERDGLLVEVVSLQKRDETRSANKKEKEAKTKAHEKAICAEVLLRHKKNFEQKLKEKTGKIEAKHVKKEHNLAAEIEQKKERIEELTEELRNLKSEHKDEIRDLKLKVKEAEKEGGPKAKEDLKQAKSDMKEKDREMEEIKQGKNECLKQVNHLKSLVKAANAGEEQCQTALNNTFREVHQLEREVTSWKSKAIHAARDGPIREQQLQAEIKQIKENYRREVEGLRSRADACTQFQRTNKGLVAQNDRNNEWRIADRQRLAQKENELKLAVIEKNRAVESEEISKNELQMLADEVRRLKEVLAQNHISPAVALGISSYGAGNGATVDIGEGEAAGEKAITTGNLTTAVNGREGVSAFATSGPAVSNGF